MNMVKKVGSLFVLIGAGIILKDRSNKGNNKTMNLQEVISRRISVGIYQPGPADDEKTFVQ
jgi:hypothetical protein